MIEMITNDGTVFKVDDWVYDKYGKYVWRVCKKSGHIKASNVNGMREQRLSKLILTDLGFDVGRIVRFLDGNKLNLQTDNITLSNLLSIESDGNLIIATLPNNQKFVVDSQFERLLLSRSWFITAEKYVVSSKDGYTSYLHREVMGLGYGDVETVDHINGDTYNNTFANLRVCTHAENMRNRAKDKVGARSRNSEHKGLQLLSDGTWRVRVGLVEVGIYADEVVAANAYNYKALELFGEYARLNEFPKMTLDDILSKRIGGR